MAIVETLCLLDQWNLGILSKKKLYGHSLPDILIQASLWCEI